MTKKQATRAFQLMKMLTANGVPDLVTANEAANICNGYGVLNTKFHRCPELEKHSRPVNLATLAVTIAKKEGVK